MSWVMWEAIGLTLLFIVLEVRYLWRWAECGPPPVCDCPDCPCRSGHDEKK